MKKCFKTPPKPIRKQKIKNKLKKMTVFFLNSTEFFFFFTQNVLKCQNKQKKICPKHGGGPIGGFKDCTQTIKKMT